MVGNSKMSCCLCVEILGESVEILGESVEILGESVEILGESVEILREGFYGGFGRKQEAYLKMMPMERDRCY